MLDFSLNLHSEIKANCWEDISGKLFLSEPQHQGGFANTCLTYHKNLEVDKAVKSLEEGDVGNEMAEDSGSALRTGFHARAADAADTVAIAADDDWFSAVTVEVFKTDVTAQTGHDFQRF